MPYGPVRISNLKERPAFADTIADRGWNAWWTDSGSSVADYRAALTPMLDGDGIPLSLVAHEGDHYIGSVLLIENDLDERPQYTPWIAALWVEPEYRMRGIAAELIKSVVIEAGKLGCKSCYLCATPEKRAYYLKQDLSLIETNVDGMDVFLIAT